MLHPTRSGILLLALALVCLTARAPAQVPSISQVVPQPTPAGTPTANITITGSNFGYSTDTVTFPGNPPVVVSPYTWMSGYLGVNVPATWSGTIYVFSGSPSPTHPFEVSYNWSGHKWFTMPFTWYLNQNGAPGCAIGDVAWALNVAYDAWECASDADHTYGGTTTRDGSAHGDGWSVQYWSTTPWADPNLIAVATHWYIIATGEIVEADIHYNGADWSWSIGGSPTTVDIQNIATHESGHTIGLLDLYGAADSEKTMYGIAGNNQTLKRTPTVSDIEGVEYMYPHAGRCNYTWGTPSGWWGPVVPRDTNDATGTWAPLQATLTGNWAGYVNFADANLGSDCAAPASWVDCYLDDAFLIPAGWEGRQNIGEVYGWTNIASTVRSGRHTYRLEYDPDDWLVESIETDNTYRAQFAWTPWGLADQSPIVRPAPPPVGTLTFPNCEAFRFTGNWWGGVGIIPVSVSDDYDLRLFDDYDGSLTGYQTAHAVSERAGSRSDIVIVNGNLAGLNATRCAGVTRYDAPTGGGVVVQQSNQVGGTYVVSTDYGAPSTTGPRILAANQIFKIHEFLLTNASLTYEIHLENVSGGADLYFAVMDNAHAYQGLGDALAYGEAGGSSANETIQFQPPLADYYGIVVYKYANPDLPISATYELIVQVAPPNLDAQNVPTGFDAPVVARNTTGAGSGNAHVTSVLEGNAPTTYLSFAVEQEGPNDSPQWLSRMYLDVASPIDEVWSGEPVPPTSVEWFNRGPFEVRGGRHSLTLKADEENLVPESDEMDNVFIQQYVWSPRALAAGSPLLREPPPPLGYEPFFNCDGLAFTRAPGYAWVVGLASLSELDDYDLALYEDYSGSQDGFDNTVTYSPMAFWDTDFIVGHYSGTPVTAYVGAVRWSMVAGAPYAIDAIDAFERNAGQEGAFFEQLMAPFRMVDVYEAYLEDGDRILFKLSQLEGTDDLQLHVFPCTAGAIYTRYDPHDVSTPFGANGEWLVYEAEATGWHPVVVCRSTGQTLESPRMYDLTWGPTAITGVGDASSQPQALVFMAPAPNPTSVGSRLSFELPRADHVRIDLFDVRGRRIGTIVDRQFAAGRYHQDWNGRDQQGREVAAGVYYAQLQVGNQVLTRRLTVMH
jgi:hypothetical protein